MTAERLRQAASVIRERAEAEAKAIEGQSVGAMLSSHDALAQIGFASIPVANAAADWLDAEYVTQAEMEPLAELINAAFTVVSGKEVGLIEFGRDAAGNVQYRTNTLPGALALADAILGEEL